MNDPRVSLALLRTRESLKGVCVAYAKALNAASPTRITLTSLLHVYGRDALITYALRLQKRCEGIPTTLDPKDAARELRRLNTTRQEYSK